MIIRTLQGNGGGYKRLLDSIDRQNIKPEHVYVVQPFGYEPPQYRLGYEEYIHTHKGMWEQRIFGMEYCHAQKRHSEYLLVCDDDVEFETDFAEKLLKSAYKHNLDILIPIKDLKYGFIKNIISKILGQRTQTTKSKYKVSIKKNGCFAVNNDLKNNLNPTQSGPFQCFLMSTDITPGLQLRSEMWLDDTKYAWPDDQVFFY
ncbi:MAG: hypothetical protein K2L77_01055, partial [Muribaculaceae bacterium]|nr:hypothetical protein [Muribaculaceae bacterium]